MSEATEDPPAPPGDTPPAGPWPAGNSPAAEKAQSGAKKSVPDIKVTGPLILFAVFIAKTYGVAGYSLTTTTALATSTPLSIAIGTAALYTYAFAAVTAVVSAVLFAAAFLEPYRARLRPLIPLTGTLTVFGALLAPYQYTADAAVAAACVLMISWLAGLISRHQAVLRLTAVTLGGLILVAFFLATLGTPWVPAEIVTMRAPVVTNPVTHQAASKPVAFVMGDDSGYTSLLMADDRFLARVKTSDIIGREICHYNDQFLGAEPLFEFLAGHSYAAHDISCFRLTDQADRMSFSQPPLIMRLLAWQFPALSHES
jgi:hypothetical protein